MKIKTRDFGLIDADENNFITFVEPILGFEQNNLYTIIHLNDVGSDFVFLQSVDDENVCFVLVNPDVLKEEYKPYISRSLNRRLDVESDSDLIIWVIGVIYEDFYESTVNLKSPILINTKNNKGAQFVTDESYPLKTLIYDKMENEKC
ncbi:MAG: flagellar assembly protein FliW [Oscillospiraceae bacterium]